MVMLGTEFGSMGGMAAVINVYRRAGLIEKWDMGYVATHVDGSRWRKLMTAVSAWGRFLGMVVAGNVAGAHIHVAAGASFWRKTLIAFPAFVAGKPVLFHIHDGEFANFYWRKCGPVRKALVRKILERSRLVIALSDTWVRELTEIAPGAALVRLPNPVELPLPGKPVAEEKNSVTILFLGRLTREKGVYDLLEAFAALPRGLTQWRLILAGNGDSEGVWQRIEELHLEREVELAGWVGKDKKLELLNVADVVVLPSYFEGMPMAILEGMAAGIPVVSTDVGGIPDVVRDSVNGLLFSPGDVAALTKCLDRLARDREFARRLGNAGRKCVESDFSVSVVLQRLENIYSEIGFQPDPKKFHIR